MEPNCPSQVETLSELERLAPGVPCLALGQTVFWDEPMKASVALALRRTGSSRAFVAGVHDTDYFAKSTARGEKGGFKSLPHNDTTTKGLWSAAGEFSSLFGSETVVTREALQAAGAKLSRVQSERPGYLDEVTEAYGWRGVVSLNPQPRVTAEKPLAPLFPTLFGTLEWAVNESLSLLSGPRRAASAAAAERLLSIACDAAEGRESLTLGDYYRRLLPALYDHTAGEPVGVETTATTELLRLSPETAGRPRFRLLELFLDPVSGPAARAAYDRAIEGSEIYPLERFGVGALPFDVVVPGVGRGTLRLGSRGGLVMTPTPVGFSYKTPPRTAAELAAVLERRFGPGCVVVGKAVTLIGMLAAEFVFVFHEGASGYVHRSRGLHRALAEAGYPVSVHPILRVGYEPWDALAECCAWFTLPEPLRRPFGVDELSGCSFADRWREVAADQKALLDRLAELRRPLDLIRFLDSELGGTWSCLASRYEALHEQVGRLNDRIAEVKARKREVSARLKAIAAERQALEREKGEHWRARIFERQPSEDDRQERDRLAAQVADTLRRTAAAREEWRSLQREQDAIASSPEADQGRSLRGTIAFEAELARLKLVRNAVVASRGLEKAGHRPSAWWFPLVCPDGAWFRATARSAHFRLEPLD